MLRESINKRVLIYDKAIKRASYKTGLRLIREKRRWLCKNDLFYLCCLLGNTKIQQWKEIYQPFCDEVSLMNWKVVQLGMLPPSEDMLKIEEVVKNPKDLSMQRLYLCYRTFFKTTIVSKVHSLQLLLNFPDIRLVLCHNKQENASDNLVTIKNYFLMTEIRKIFPECIPNTKEWGNMTGFNLANRTDFGKDEASIEAVGVDTEITGRHWHIAKKDDLVTEKSVTTEEQILKTIDWDERFNIGQFDEIRHTLQDYSGTRYHFADIYAKKKNDPHIKVIEIPILNDKKEINHPQRFSPEEIDSLKGDLWVFNCQMMLRPEDPAKMTFKTEMISYYEYLPPECNYYLLVDPASQRKKKSDYTAMMVVGVTSKGRYIAEIIRDKLTPDQRIGIGLSLAQKWHIKGCGWEEVGLGDDTHYLEEKRREKGLFFYIEPIKTSQISKEDRIRNILIPEYASHKWFWPKKGTMVKYSEFHGKNFDMTEALEHEFLQFPLCEHDDLMDAQTFLSKMNVILPEEIEYKEESPMTFGDLIALKEDRLRKTRENPWSELRPLSRV